jgi:hypothetical protein
MTTSEYDQRLKDLVTAKGSKPGTAGPYSAEHVLAAHQHVLDIKDRLARGVITPDAASVELGTLGASGLPIPEVPGAHSSKSFYSNVEKHLGSQFSPEHAADWTRLPAAERRRLFDELVRGGDTARSPFEFKLPRDVAARPVSDMELVDAMHSKLNVRGQPGGVPRVDLAEAMVPLRAGQTGSFTTSGGGTVSLDSLRHTMQLAEAELAAPKVSIPGDRARALLGKLIGAKPAGGVPAELFQHLGKPEAIMPGTGAVNPATSIGQAEMKEMSELLNSPALKSTIPPDALLSIQKLRGKPEFGHLITDMERALGAGGSGVIRIPGSGQVLQRGELEQLRAAIHSAKNPRAWYSPLSAYGGMSMAVPGTKARIPLARGALYPLSLFGLAQLNRQKAPPILPPELQGPK